MQHLTAGFVIIGGLLALSTVAFVAEFFPSFFEKLIKKCQKRGVAVAFKKKKRNHETMKGA
jgi:hypothetical protein